MKRTIAINSALVMITLGSWLTAVSPVQANGQVPFQHGAQCEAANLGQALKGIGWNQVGVVNNSDRSFFVVCPLTRNAGETSPVGGGIYATFPSGGGSIPCTWRALDPFDGSRQFMNVTVVSGSTSAFVPTLGAADVTLISFDTDPGNRHWSVVCSLDPGEGIRGFVIGYDLI